MRFFILFADLLNTWVGKSFAWCIVVLCFGTVYEVFMAYVLRAPTLWNFDFSLQMYGALFIMGGAYALCTEAHIRGDVIYRLLSVKKQATLDLVLYIIFFMPGVCALAFAGIDYAGNAWKSGETSWNSPAKIQIYMIKSLIPLTGFLLIIQGLSEMCRCVIAIKSGNWPKREVVDAEETEKLLMRTSHEDPQERNI
jgi:TRAP-type mannitol/chloroaromatic compound transport system permease small subunit|tara:strand:- start:214 stop:801 length:588 start_codon:yes stop_codon:yes gene_type:complete